MFDSSVLIVIFQGKRLELKGLTHLKRGSEELEWEEEKYPYRQQEYNHCP